MDKVKPFWQSKTFWVNTLATAGIVVQSQTAYVLDPEMQVGIIGFINIALRFVTKDGVSLS